MHIDDLDDNSLLIEGPKEEKHKPMYLDDRDLLEIKYNAERIKVHEKDKIISQLKLEILKAQAALIESQNEVIKRDSMLVEHQREINRGAMQADKQKAISTLEVISSKFPSLIGKKWGYNPETGEIIINEDVQAIDS